jgi:hypothetical protein
MAVQCRLRLSTGNPETKGPVFAMGNVIQGLK